MTLDTLVRRLMREGTIERDRVNRYRICSSHRSLALCRQYIGQIVTLRDIHAIFTIRIFGDDFRLRTLSDTYTADNIVGRLPIVDPLISQEGELPFFQESPIQATRPEPLRTIERRSYHSTGGGSGRTGIERALLAIAPDEDGVRRSFGLEWEIFALTPRQEDKLARLLDTLPEHVTERDGSLSNTGVEIVFMPMGEQKYIETFTTLKNFCRENSIQMDRTGAHTTYGVSNARCTRDDLQIRINRIALAVKAASTQRAIKTLFGRDFTSYATLPQSTTYQSHSNAWSASRGSTAYELRLISWQGEPTLIAQFMRETEFVFQRPFEAEDFMKIFRLLGSDASTM